MYLAKNKVLVPKQWFHSSYLYDKCGRTVALWYALNGIIPNK